MLIMIFATPVCCFNIVAFVSNFTKEGTFPICYAAMQGHLSVVKYLLQQELNTERLLTDKKVRFSLCLDDKEILSEKKTQHIL